MEKVVELLQEKNQFLEKFFRLNEAELMNFSEGNFDNLENFYKSREGILEMVLKFDGMIDEATPDAVEPVKVENGFKKQILEALDHKNELVTRILGQDLQILSFIEDAKSKIIKDLSQVKSARKAIGSYKVKPNGNRLDEEA